jgi:hypothetical protein
MSAGNVKIAVTIKAWEIIASGIKSGTIPSEFAAFIDVPTGTTDGACDVIYTKSESGKAASGTTSYDLTALVDTYGTAITFAETFLIVLWNKRTTALATLSVGPHATNGHGVLSSGRGYWNAALGSGGGNIVQPSHATRADLKSFLVLHNVDGVPVVNGSTDVLAVTTSAVSGDTNAWDLMVVGRSA